jgi:hypothetical protein
VIDEGPAVFNLLRAVPTKDVLTTARRHGDIYRGTRNRLAVGIYHVAIPEGAHWELTVTFPDKKTSVLSPDTRRRENEFGSVTVTGPNRKGREWSLMVDVELAKK